MYTVTFLCGMMECDEEYGMEERIFHVEDYQEEYNLNVHISIYCDDIVFNAINVGNHIVDCALMRGRKGKVNKSLILLESEFTAKIFCNACY